MEQISTSIAELRFDEQNSLLHVTIKEGAMMDVKNLEEHYSKIEKITKGKKYIALVDVSQPYFIDHLGTKYASDPATLKNRTAAAYYNPPLSNRLSLMGLQQGIAGRIPTFIAMEKIIALKWLDTVRVSCLK